MVTWPPARPAAGRPRVVRAGALFVLLVSFALVAACASRRACPKPSLDVATGSNGSHPVPPAIAIGTVFTVVGRGFGRPCGSAGGASVRLFVTQGETRLSLARVMPAAERGSFRVAVGLPPGLHRGIAEIRAQSDRLADTPPLTSRRVRVIAAPR